MKTCDAAKCLRSWLFNSNNILPAYCPSYYLLHPRRELIYYKTHCGCEHLSALTRLIVGSYRYDRCGSNDKIRYI